LARGKPEGLETTTERKGQIQVLPLEQPLPLRAVVMVEKIQLPEVPVVRVAVVLTMALEVPERLVKEIPVVLPLVQVHRLAVVVAVEQEVLVLLM